MDKDKYIEALSNRDYVEFSEIMKDELDKKFTEIIRNESENIINTFNEELRGG